MSAVTRRSSIRQANLVDTGKVLNTSAQVVIQSAKFMGQAAQSAFHLIHQAIAQPQAQSRQSIQSTIEVQQQQVSLGQTVKTLTQQQGLTELETLQIHTLIAASQWQIESPQLIQQVLQPIMAASSVAVAQPLAQAGLQQLSQAHHQLFVQQVIQACTQAALKVGFSQLVQAPTQLENTVRLIASDATGKSLVTEIQVDAQQPVSMATELLGSSDQTCQAILDAYDRALEEAGLHSEKPERKFTGGICQLAAAQEFIRRPIKPAIAPRSIAKPRPQPRPQNRPQRLNQQQQ